MAEKPVQLNINGMDLPWTSGDKYSAGKEELGSSKRTIGGRMVTESRGFYWVVTYAYDYMGNKATRQLLKILRSGEVTAMFLPDDGEGYVTAKCKCTTLHRPTLAFARNGEALWHNISFTLESVEAVKE